MNEEEVQPLGDIQLGLFNSSAPNQSPSPDQSSPPPLAPAPANFLAELVIYGMSMGGGVLLGSAASLKFGTTRSHNAFVGFLLVVQIALFFFTFVTSVSLARKLWKGAEKKTVSMFCVCAVLPTAAVASGGVGLYMWIHGK